MQKFADLVQPIVVARVVNGRFHDLVSVAVTHKAVLVVAFGLVAQVEIEVADRDCCGKNFAIRGIDVATGCRIGTVALFVHFTTFAPFVAIYPLNFDDAINDASVTKTANQPLVIYIRLSRLRQ